MISIRFGAAVLFAGLALWARPATAFAGSEREYPEFNFAIVPPEGWKDTTLKISKPGLCAGFAAPDSTGWVFVLRDDIHPPPGELDDRFVAHYEEVTEQGGAGKRLSGRFVFLQGIKSYERTGAPVIQDKPMSLLSRAIPVPGHFYTLQGYRSGGVSAAEDPTIRGFMESFRLLTPRPPAPRFSVNLKPDAAAKPDAKIARPVPEARSARLAPWTWLTLAGIAGAVVLVVWRRPRRRHEPAAPSPAPVPEGTPESRRLPSTEAPVPTLPGETLDATQEPHPPQREAHPRWTGPRPRRWRDRE